MSVSGTPTALLGQLGWVRLDTQPHLGQHVSGTLAFVSVHPVILSVLALGRRARVAGVSADRSDLLCVQSQGSGVCLWFSHPSLG